MLKFRKEHLNLLHTLNSSRNPFVVERAQGVYFYDVEGRRLLDCVNNVSHIGHCHPVYVERMREQLGRLLTNARFLYPQLQSCVEKILGLFGPEMKYVSFTNSGSEANDLALQMGMCYAGTSTVAAIDGAYHGQVQGLLEISPYRWMPEAPFERRPLLFEMPCTYRGAHAGKPDATALYAKDVKIQLQAKPVAFIHESMLSCAGQVIPLPDYFAEVYKAVRQHGGVCIADEVQTGFGRLGTHFWGFEYYNVKPEIVTIGKAMGNGFPVAAVVCTDAVMQAYAKKRKEFFSTYSGNPLACVAAETVIDVIREEKLQDNAYVVGQYMSKRLQELLDYKFVGDIRGVGLFQGVEIVSSRETKEADERTAAELAARMREHSVLISRDGMKENVLKMKPPIVFSKDNVDEMMDAFHKSCKEVAALDK